MKGGNGKYCEAEGEVRKIEKSPGYGIGGNFEVTHDR